MHKQLLTFKYGESHVYEYLGSDGLPITESYNLYLRKCEEFKGRARKYNKDNSNLKNSVLHYTKLGYQRCEQLEEQVLLDREQDLNLYKKFFQINSFSEDPNSMYECFTGKSKRIRVIRELHQNQSEGFSDDFDKKRGNWFTRYCILSRFIEVARKIILLNRLKKHLKILKLLNRETIKKIEDETKEKRQST